MITGQDLIERTRILSEEQLLGASMKRGQISWSCNQNVKTSRF